jgi:formamidopyrimidine-DNA glycosylase
LTPEALTRLFRKMRRVLRVAARHGGKVSRLPGGYLLRRRSDDGRCPRCRKRLKKTKISGRTSYFCPRDQPGH